jgi:hypothetical protein
VRLGLGECVESSTVRVGVALPEVEGLREARGDTEALLEGREALAEGLEEGHAEGVVREVGAGDTVVLTDRDLEMVGDTVEVVVAHRVRERVGVEVPPTLEGVGRLDADGVMDMVRQAVEDVERRGLRVPDRDPDWVIDREGEGVEVVDSVMVEEAEGVAVQKFCAAWMLMP